VRALLAPDEPAAVGALLAWSALEALGRARDPANAAECAVRLFDSLRLRAVVADEAGQLGIDGEERWRAAARVRVALARASRDWLSDPDAAWLAGVHEYQGVRYLVKEPFERLVWWRTLPALLRLAAEPSPPAPGVRALEREIAAAIDAAAVAGYRLP
jgi:hypothetical protein